ncbi:dual specificity protein kinase TTK isoform X2 [Neocloeon triangulifer]|uniref:dual specificity protein kinase TTK isoform X2 n=1 Tax=Neocloeon triangulifer TaxID=2078957 RepID=UPI00286EEC4B|nr:dual specificity protein kinase TTK isoform X2 [Neocloeon triangulifer]
MYQHTMPALKDEGRDEHSGHSGHQWPTQPSSTLPRSRSFFARLTQMNKNGTPANSTSFPNECPEAGNAKENEQARKPLLRSPSLPSLRVDISKDVGQVCLFESPIKQELQRSNKHANEDAPLRRSPSVSSLKMSNRHGSPIPQHINSRATPLPKNVAQNNAQNTMFDVQTPSQPNISRANQMHSSTRAPLQSITPLNRRESHKKDLHIIDKENVQNYTNKNLPNLDCKEPTPEWKKEILQQFMETSPAAMNNFSAKRPCAAPSSLCTKAARTLFHSSSPDVPDSVDIFRDHVQTIEQGNLFSSSKQSFQANHILHNTPVPAKKTFPQQKEPFEFKQPILPQQKLRQDSGDHDYIVVHDIPYRKGERLGKGGSSEVFQVFRMSDDSEFALKIVCLKESDEATKKGFLNEISLLARMQGCERVIQLIDFELCEDKEVLFVIMEKGVRDLSALLKDRAKRKDMRVSTVEAFWKDMVAAVAAIHEQGIIHSDLKPANFLLFGEVGFHQLKLIDFGIASSIQTDMTSVIKEHPAGTFNYMSPEALQGTNVKINFKSDIWSLGCILYCLLYGVTPFQHIKNYQQKTAAICDPNHVIQFPERSPNMLEDGLIPLPLLETVQLCLSHNPADRPSAKDLLKIKYCGCEKPKPQKPHLDILAHGLASLVKEHPLGKQLAPLLISALAKANENQ